MGQPRDCSTNLQCYSGTHRRSNSVSGIKVMLLLGSRSQTMFQSVNVRQHQCHRQSVSLIHLQVAESRTIDGWWRDGWLVPAREREVTLVLKQSSLDNQMDKYNLTPSSLMFLETCNKQVQNHDNKYYKIPSKLLEVNTTSFWPPHEHQARKWSKVDWMTPGQGHVW